MPIRLTPAAGRSQKRLSPKSQPITPSAWSDWEAGASETRPPTVQADAAGDQHYAALNGPENPATWRANTAWSSVQGDGRRFEELGSGGRLDVSEQILICGKAVKEFGLGIGLDFGQSAPPSYSQPAHG
jgi:hypothetical protein